jgi:hypothetical protein
MHCTGSIFVSSPQGSEDLSRFVSRSRIARVTHCATRVPLPSMADLVAPEDSVSQVGAASVAPGNGMIVPVAKSDIYGERKRLYGQMDNQAQHLTPAALATYAASKGNHKKRQKILELFIANGRNMGMAMNLYMDIENIERQGSVASWQPMTAKQIQDPQSQLQQAVSVPIVSITQYLNVRCRGKIWRGGRRSSAR